MSLLRFLHRWTGAALFLLVALIAFTGTASALRTDYIRLTLPAAKAPAPSVITLGPALTYFELNHPGVLESVKFSPYDLGVHRLYLANGAGAYIDRDGSVVHKWTNKARSLDDAVLDLHQTFLLGDRGSKVVGLVGLFAMAMIVTGLIIAAPNLAQFSANPWPRSLDRRDLLGSHRSLGVLIAVFMFVQVLTGFSIIFDGKLRGLFGAAKPAPPPLATNYPAPPQTDWPRIIQTAQLTFPGADVRRAVIPRQPGEPYVIYLRGDGDVNPEGSSQAYLSPDGRLLAKFDNARATGMDKVFNNVLGIHSGQWGAKGKHDWRAKTPRYLTAVIGLLTGFLAMAGGLAFLRSLMPRRRVRIPYA